MVRIRRFRCAHVDIASDLDGKDDARGQRQAAGSDMGYRGKHHRHGIFRGVKARNICGDAQEDLQQRDRQETDCRGA